MAEKVFGFSKVVDPSWRVYYQLTQINTVEALDNLLKDLPNLDQIDKQIREKFGPEISELVKEIQCTILAQQLSLSSQVIQVAVVQANVSLPQSSTSDLDSPQPFEGAQVTKDQAELAGAIGAIGAIGATAPSLPPHGKIEPCRAEKVRASSGNQPYLDSALGSLSISLANSEPDFSNALQRASSPWISLTGQRLAHDSLDVSTAGSTFDLNTSGQPSDNLDVFQD